MPKAVVGGIRNARKRYLEMAGEIDKWPEYWVATYVAKVLWNKFGRGGFVTMENQAKNVLTRKSGRPSKYSRGRLKYDIVLWNGEGDVRAIIEIKHQISAKKVVGEVKRIAAALGGGKVVGFGAIGYYYHYNKSGKNPREALRQYHENVLTEAEELLERTQFRVTDESKCRSAYYMPNDKSDDEENYWIAGCLTIRRKKWVRKK